MAVTMAAVTAVMNNSSLYPDWRARLARWATLRVGAPFEWGRSDCALICFEAVDCIRRGSNLAAQYRGAWDSMHGAIRFQREHGTDLRAALTAAGLSAHAGPAATGDIILHSPEGYAFVAGNVAVLNYIVSAHPEYGVALGRLADAVAYPGAQIMRVAV